MYTRILGTAVVLGSLIAGILAPAVSVSAQADPPTRPMTKRIACGLRAGSLFDISLAERCMQATTSSTPTAPAPTGRYAALGDSVAAGDGLPVDTSYPYSQCRQSTQGYPNAVATRTGLQLTNVSCSGATVGDLVTAQRVDGPDIPAQISRAFADGTPELLTFTAGANDVQWNRFVAACYQDDCTQDRYEVAARALLAVYRQKLDYALGAIERHSNGKPPQVIVTGYYNPLSRACAAQQSALTRQEISWLTRQLNALNRSIRAEVRERQFATYVSISFASHDLCSKKPWVQGLDAAAPLHPTAEGQAYIARRVAAAVK